MFELFGGVEKSMVVATWVLAISTFILASAAILGFGATIKTLCDNNKIKKAEFLKDLYKDFSKESISNFFVNLEGAIKDKKESELLPNPMDRNGYNNEDRVENEKSLISLLVLFDEIYYFHETKLICKKELDYFAYELKLLSESQAIQNYINQYHELIDSFPYNFEEIRDIYPFTGLRLLYEHYCKINNLTSSVELHTVQDKKEVIMTKSDCSNGCKLVSWYNEVDTASKGSGVEIFIFYLSMVTTLIFLFVYRVSLFGLCQ
jgi:hypothetical protein